VRKKIILFILLEIFPFFSFGYDFNTCLSIFKEEKFIEAGSCFHKIKDKHLAPYKQYYLNLISQIYDDEEKNITKETAIKNYYLLSKTARAFYKKNYNFAEKYLKKIDYKALDEENFIFYLYLKANILNDNSLKKILATKYIYNRAYGYKTFLEIYQNLSQTELWQAVETLISKRMYLRAEGILPLIKSSDKKRYYLLYIYVKNKKYDKAKQLLKTINPKTKWYLSALYILIYYLKNWKEKRELFRKLLKTNDKKYIGKVATFLAKKAFHLKRLSEFNFYKLYMPNSETKVWYEFLHKYFFISKRKAFKYLSKNSKSISNKNKLNYWLYLSSKEKKYLNFVKNSPNFDFYKILARGENNFKPKHLFTNNLKEDYILVKKLKQLGLYDKAYKEAKYLYKKEKDVKQIYTVMPEVVIKNLKEEYRFIKPFGELNPLVYATMKQESLFYYKAISVSNAVGLMQFIPSTAYWISKVRKDKNFDIVKMFNPKVSIDYGKWYLNYLLKRFNGNVFYTISAYNGGGHNVIRNIKRFNPKNIAEFIETHPFDETRNYLKKVYTNYVIYKN